MASLIRHNYVFLKNKHCTTVRLMTYVSVPELKECEPVREKTNNLHGRKQRRRSASR